MQLIRLEPNLSMMLHGKLKLLWKSVTLEKSGILTKVLLDIEI